MSSSEGLVDGRSAGPGGETVRPLCPGADYGVVWMRTHTEHRAGDRVGPLGTFPAFCSLGLPLHIEEPQRMLPTSEGAVPASSFASQSPVLSLPQP